MCSVIHSVLSTVSLYIVMVKFLAIVCSIRVLWHRHIVYVHSYMLIPMCHIARDFCVWKLSSWLISKVTFLKMDVSWAGDFSLKFYISFQSKFITLLIIWLSSDHCKRLIIYGSILYITSYGSWHSHVNIHLH